VFFILFLVGIKANQLQKRALIDISHDSLMLIERIIENPLQIQEILKSCQKSKVSSCHRSFLLLFMGQI
jgi:transposase